MAANTFTVSTTFSKYAVPVPLGYDGESVWICNGCEPGEGFEHLEDAHYYDDPECDLCGATREEEEEDDEEEGDE